MWSLVIQIEIKLLVLGKDYLKILCANGVIYFANKFLIKEF